MTTRKPKPKAADATPVAVRARALAEAAIRGDRETAEAYGVALMTLRVWRHRLGDDPALAAMYEAHARRLADTWRPAVTGGLVAAVEELRKRLPGMDDALLLGAVRALGEINVTNAALAPQEVPDARDAGQGAGVAAEAGPPPPETAH